MDSPVPEDPARNAALDARPGPAEEHNTGAATPPRQAATVILLRGGADTLEILLVRRTPEAKFMGGVWVFPGGAVDATDGARPGDPPAEDDRGSPRRGDGSGPGDSDGNSTHRAAAIRELREEAGIVLEDPSALVAFSRWITPAEVKVRFDTRFFLAPLPPSQEPRIDGEECVEHGWFSPQGALDAHAAGEIVLVFPTIKHLEQLAPFPSVNALLAHARDLVIEPVLPRVIVQGDSARVLMPGDPGY